MFRIILWYTFNRHISMFWKKTNILVNYKNSDDYGLIFAQI